MTINFKLLQYKNTIKCSKKVFDSLHVLLADILRKNNTSPFTYYSIKTLIKNLIWGMKKLIHVKMIVCCTTRMMHQSRLLYLWRRSLQKTKEEKSKEEKCERNTAQGLKAFFTYSSSAKILYVRIYGQIYDMAQD